MFLGGYIICKDGFGVGGLFRFLRLFGNLDIKVNF